jgi:defect-in-organelle-trafficking protein DotC
MIQKPETRNQKSEIDFRRGLGFVFLISGFWFLVSGPCHADDVIVPDRTTIVDSPDLTDLPPQRNDIVVPDKTTIVNTPDVPGTTHWGPSPFEKTYEPVGEGKPPTLDKLQDIEASEQKQEVGFQVRVEAQKEAALSYGLRGGLAWRTYQINQRLARFANPLTRIYDFRRLLMAAPGGVYVEPPVIEEQLEALQIENQGQSAALTDKVLTITANAKLVTTARDWRNYLIRDWGHPDDPPDILLPKTDEERANWKKWVAEGWQKGIEQADDIFAEDNARLTRDFTGMIRYRKLLAEAMVSAPYAGLVDRGVTGGGVEMRIGDRAVTITGPAQLRNQSMQWHPISISQPH